MTKDKGGVQRSVKWSLFSEVATKLVTPITNMVLARILTPNDFGVLAICNMLVSFMDIITDAGFGKYLVQHDFKNTKEQQKNANVAFWSNLLLSLVLFVGIVIFRAPIASALGKIEYSAAIAVASAQLILTSVSSIQTGLLRRSFDFKKLFIARISLAISPLIITVPLAIITKSYWALIIGNIGGAFVNATVLTLMSSWKPKFYYSTKVLKEMFGFSFWSLCEGLANWAIFWVDTFIVANLFDEYYTGLYKNSSNMVISIMGMISASMSPVLLSSLSRIKNNKDKYFSLFLSIQRIMLYLVIPMGLGLFCYRRIITHILLGSKWIEAANIIGAWGLMMMLSVIFYSFIAELFKSKGIPKILFLSQCLYLVLLIPICIFSAKMGFWYFVYARCVSIILQIIINLSFVKIVFKFSIKKMLSNTLRPLLAACVIPISYLFFRHFISTELSELIPMIMSAIIYIASTTLFFKKDLISLYKTLSKTSLKERTT